MKVQGIFATLGNVLRPFRALSKTKAPSKRKYARSYLFCLFRYVSVCVVLGCSQRAAALRSSEKEWSVARIVFRNFTKPQLYEEPPEKE
jgi:hypothetical protein